MLKLIKFAAFVFVTVWAGYFLLSLSFGEKTLYQHLVTISETNEAKSLKSEIEKKVDGATTNISQKAKDLAIKEVKRELDEIRNSKKDADPPASDDISPSDKASLEKLIEKKEKQQHTEHLTADRRSLDRLIQKKNRE